MVNRLKIAKLILNFVDTNRDGSALPISCRYLKFLFQCKNIFPLVLYPKNLWPYLKNSLI